MQIHGLGYHTNRYLLRSGVAMEDRLRLSARDYQRLIQYSEQFFRRAPTTARRVAKMSDPVLTHGFEMTTAAIFDRREIDIPFVVGWIYSNQPIKSLLRPELERLTVWSRRYIDEMPQDLRLEIFRQKLAVQTGYQAFIAANPSFQLVDIYDLSSGRFFSQRSVYRLVFLDTADGREISVILKPAAAKYDLASAKPANESFYSRYLDLFGREPVRISLYADQYFAEFVDGIPSWQLFSDGRLKQEYAHLADHLVEWLGQEAALADAVNKGDRDVGFGGKPWGNFIIMTSPDGKEIVRVVSIDHEFVFNRTDTFTTQSAEDGQLEMSFLTALPGFRDPAKRAEMFAKFKSVYHAMLARIRQKKGAVEALIRQSYGEGDELRLFASGLARDPEAWLVDLLARTELFWQRRQGVGLGS